MSPFPDRAALIRTVSDWFSSQPEAASPVVPALQREFGLTTKEAIEAIRLHQGGDAFPETASADASAQRRNYD